MRYLLNLRVLTLIAISLIGCSRDKELDIKGKKEGDVVLQLTSPGGYTKGTKATRGLICEQENNIKDVYVLVFNTSNTLVDIRKANNISTGATVIKTFTVSLTPSETEGAEHKQKLFILSNAEEILGNTIGKTISEVTTDKSYENIITAIKGKIDGKMYSTGGEIPMWGETGLLTIKGGNSNGSGMANPINLLLMRCVARIDVGVGAHQVTDGITSWDGKNSVGATIPFKLNTIYVISPNKEYVVTPAVSNRSADGGKNIVTAPTITGGKFTFAESIEKFTFTSSGDILYPGDGSYGGYTIQSIYLPEADVKMGESGASGDSNHGNRLAIVVGGFYNGSGTQTFYRIDVSTAGVIMNLLRNHLYQFNIISVSGAGHLSAELAYKSQSMNMQVDVIAWNDVELADTEFDGQNYFSISERRVIFTPLDGQKIDLAIKTNVKDFEIEKSDGTILLKATGTRTYTDSETGFKYTLTKVAGSEENYNLTIEATQHNVFTDGAVRENDLRIKASRLVLPLNIQQQTASEFISAGNESVFTYTPAGTTAGEDLIINIITSSPITVKNSVDIDWVTVTTEGLDKPVNGLYKGKVIINVGIYAKLSANDVKRECLIKITPQGQESTNINIVQMAPYLRIATGNFEIPRTAPQYKKVVTIQTNLPIDKLTITPAGSDNGHTRITHDNEKGLYKMDNQEGTLAFDVNADMTAPLPKNAYRKTFTVSADRIYGENPSITAVFTTMAEGSSSLFNYLWENPAVDATKTYIFAWQQEKVEFKIVSGVGLALYDSEGVGNTPHAGILTEGTSFVDANYNNVYPYTFTFNNSSYATVKSYLLMFCNEDKTHPMNISFSQSAQQFEQNSYTPTLTGIGYKGYSTTAPSNVTITSNVEWSVKSNGVDWIKVKKGDGEWTTNLITTDDKITAPIEIAEGKDVTTQPGQNKSTNLSFAILPNNVLNGAPREASITLTNHSYSKQNGSTTHIHTTPVTQYAPILKISSHNVSGTIPAAGGTYTIVANTNLQGWGVKVLNGVIGTLVSKAFGSSPVIGDGMPNNYSLQITVPANTGTSQRPLNFVLYSTEFTGTGTEVHVASGTQDIYSYTVDYDGNEHTGGELPSSQTVTNGTSINVALVGTMVKAHSDFRGWSTQKTGGTLLTPGAQLVVTENTTLYAQWSDKIYTIKLYGQGVANPTPLTGTNGTVLNLESLSRTNYEFIGWGTSSGAITGTMTHKITGDAELWAIWKPLQYTVTFNANGGSGTPPAALTTPINGNVKLPTQGNLTRSNYVFVGWNKTSTQTVGTSAGTYITPTGDETWYAIWYKVVGITSFYPRVVVEGTGVNARLILAQDLTSRLMFKHGSVLGIARPTGAETYSASRHLKYNPTTTSNPAWSQIINQTTSIVQHTVTSLKAGQGDPCRLVGYTVATIQSMLANNVAPDNKTWRLPKKSDQLTLEGSAQQYPNGAWIIAINGLENENILPISLNTEYSTWSGGISDKISSRQYTGLWMLYDGSVSTNRKSRGCTEYTRHVNSEWLYVDSDMLTCGKYYGVIDCYEVRCVRQ